MIFYFTLNLNHILSFPYNEPIILYVSLLSYIVWNKIKDLIFFSYCRQVMLFQIELLMESSLLLN